MDIAVSMPAHDSWHATSWFAWVYWCCLKKKPAPIMLHAGFRFKPLCGHQNLLGIPHPAMAASRFKKACWGLQVLFIKRIATPPHRGRFKPQKHHRRNPIGEPSDIIACKNRPSPKWPACFRTCQDAERWRAYQFLQCVRKWQIYLASDRSCRLVSVTCSSKFRTLDTRLRQTTSD